MKGARTHRPCRSAGLKASLREFWCLLLEHPLQGCRCDRHADP